MSRLRFGLVVTVILLPVLFLFSTCDKDSPTKPIEPEPPPPPPTPVATRIEVTPSTATLNAIGQTVQLTARVLDQNNNALAGASIAWTSSAVGIATVSSAGLVTAVANGTAVITATSGNVSATVNVTVSQTAGSIVIEPDMVTLMSIGQTIQLTAIVRDGSGEPVADAAVTWQSSDESVAAVSSQGLVTAVKYGTTVITARSGDAFNRINVMVIQSVRSIAIEPREATLTYIGASVQLAVTVLDQNEQPIENAMVTWESSDESVATVNAQGLVTAVMGGDARITARLGELEDSIWVTVEILAPRTERDVLALLYHSMGGTEWDNNTNWLSARPLEEWYGVSAYNGLVTGLFLDNNGLKGTLPVEFALLTDLSALSLKGNELTGEIPGELGLLRILNILDLSENNLTGNIPAELRGIDQLIRLNLSQNNLTGSIPAELGQLSLLSRFLQDAEPAATIDLSYNQLTGPIPSELGDLVNVVFLSLSHNKLTGNIPVELGQLANVTSLDMSGNQFTGVIPREFGNLVKLRTLRLDDNPSLSGPLPLEMIELEHLTGLYLGRTQLCIPSVLEEWAGSIEKVESSFCEMGSSDRDVLIAFYHATDGENWTNNNNWLSSQPLSQWFGVSTDADGRVDQLNLEGNNLAGIVTPVLAHLTALTSLDLGGNPSLAGQLPLEFTDLPLERIRVAGTEVCAPLDEAFQAWLMQVLEGGSVTSCDQFVQLDRSALIELYHATDGPNWNYSTNWLTDLPIENWIGVTTEGTGRVISLNLNSAGLNGMIPAGLAQLTGLEKLDLAYGELTGTIPPEFGRLIRLNELSLKSNQLDGSIPPEIGHLQDLVRLSLEYNQLTGGIPPEIGQLRGLIQLKLNHNKLSGMIPPEIGQLRGLIQLKLNHNKLSGMIPPELGQLQSLTILELNDNQLTGDIPPEIGKLNNLRKLQLGDNQLEGEIPSEIGQLGSLKTLNLYDNQLSGEIPPEIGQLGNLTNLALVGNQLSGEIPSALGSLNKLEYLWLRENQLSGNIPREISQLAVLKDLILDTNHLSGEIPPEIGDLSTLENLWLFKNQLTGEIPAEIGELGNLIKLILNDNQLSGNIPPEIGKMNALWLLHLEDNLLSGEIPPELGEMDQLYEIKLSNNENMSGPIPIEMTNSASMRTLFLEGTQICAPDNAIFEAWLGNLEVVRVDRCRRSTGSMVYLTQATQSFEGFPVPLVAGEDALLRVFVISSENVDENMPPVRATFFQDGAEIHRVEIAGGATNIPSAIDEGSLSSSSNEIIPGSVLAPGLELVIEIDPDGTLDPSLGIQARIPPTGRLPVDVRNVPGLDLTVVPLLWSEDPDHSVVAETEGLTRDDDLFRATRYLLPVRDADFSVTVREPLFTSVDPVFEERDQLISEIKAIRVLDGASGHYMGVLRDWGGATHLGGRVLVASLDDGVVAHEIGHTMNLLHAPCGTVGDSRYPYSDGSIGTWGYDILENRMVSPDTPDVMSFCLDDFWISDYHFRRALVYLIRGEPTELVSSSTAASPVMLLWGRINGRDELVIEPSFVVHAPPYLPSEDGPYQLAGYDASGNTLFTLNFDMGEIVHGEGGGSFAYTIPIASGWSDRLSRITLTGPEGFAEMTKNSSPSVALLRDQFTGEVRGFMRDSTGSDMTLQQSRRVVPESGLDVVISPGIPDSADW